MLLFRFVIPLALLACVLATPAEAHRVIASGYVAGNTIEGEISFSNGQAAAGAVVEVLSADGRPLGQATTDAEGFFTYTPTEQVPHIFRVDLGSGHVGQFRIDLGAGGDDTTTPSPAALPDLGDIDGATLQALIAEAVRAEMRPIRSELIAQREAVKLEQILGGLGAIAGLFGLGFYLVARKQLRDHHLKHHHHLDT